MNICTSRVMAGSEPPDRPLKFTFLAPQATKTSDDSGGYLSGGIRGCQDITPASKSLIEEYLWFQSFSAGAARRTTVEPGTFRRLEGRAHNSSSSHKPMTPKPKTVLVVDDDEGIRGTLTAILKREYRITTAVTGEEALAILRREDVDLILLDVRLPGINGFEVLKIVKENYSLTEVIMISAITEVETAVQAMKTGAYHYITKELDYDQATLPCLKRAGTAGPEPPAHHVARAGRRARRTRVRAWSKQGHAEHRGPGAQGGQASSTRGDPR